MANFDLVKAQGATKRVWHNKLEEVGYAVESLKNNPGFASLKMGKGTKVTTPFGEGYVLPVQSAFGGSTSTDLTTSETIDADGTGSTPNFDQFLITPSKLYTTQQIDGDVLDRIKDEGAFINASKKIVQDAMRAHMRKLCVLSHGTGSGKIGTIQSAPTSTTITVKASEVRNIERGDRLVAAAAETSGGLRSSTYLRVTGRNTVTGVITLSGDPTALNWASGDSVFWASARNSCPKGFFAWDPQTAPTTGDSHFGVDRSSDPVRLGGNRFDCTNMGFREALIKASLAAIAEGAQPTRTRVSPEDYARICVESEELPSFKASTTQGETTIGFTAVMLAGVGPVLLDESMPEGHFMMEDESAWMGLSDDGKLAHILSHDGLIFRKAAGDIWTITIKSLLQFACARPGHVLHGFNYGS